MAAPTVLSWIAVVTWKRSINIPIEIVLKTPAALTRAIWRVPVEGLRLNERANVGR